MNPPDQQSAAPTMPATLNLPKVRMLAAGMVSFAHKHERPSQQQFWTELGEWILASVEHATLDRVFGSIVAGTNFDEPNGDD